MVWKRGWDLENIVEGIREGVWRYLWEIDFVVIYAEKNIWMLEASNSVIGDLWAKNERYEGKIKLLNSLN